jgi:hypothetical protein
MTLSFIRSLQLIKSRNPSVVHRARFLFQRHPSRRQKQAQVSQDSPQKSMVLRCWQCLVLYYSEWRSARQLRLLLLAEAPHSWQPRRPWVHLVNGRSRPWRRRRRRPGHASRQGRAPLPRAVWSHRRRRRYQLPMLNHRGLR